LIGNRSRMK